MKWNTATVLEAIRKCSRVTSAKVTAEGEDHVTQQITVTVLNSEENVYVRGFDTNRTLEAGDDVEVEMVECTTGYSDGDMPKDGPYVLAHAEVHVAIMNLGYHVVKSLEAYF